MAIGNAGRSEFLGRLQKGLKGIGATTPSGRRLAAQLLSGIGWMSDAGPYLPLDREEWDKADTLTLVLTLAFQRLEKKLLGIAIPHAAFLKGAAHNSDVGIRCEMTVYLKDCIFIGIFRLFRTF